MALSPSIPTSFVPKQSASPGGKHGSSGNNILLLISLVILSIAVLASAGIFLYDQYLISTEHAKSAQLAQAQKNVNLSTVSDFIRLRDRLVAAKSILDNHIELSKFFTLLGAITGQNVSFSSLQVQVANDHSAKIELQGTAKTFNALANESSVFASQSDIKSAIFSGISIGKGSVGFTVDATLAPELVVEGSAPTGVVAATTTTPQSIASSTPSSPVIPSMPAVIPVPPTTPVTTSTTSPKTTNTAPGSLPGAATPTKP